MTIAQVSILLATHNGLSWLPEQIDSILSQQSVDVRILISDDASTDGSIAWLQCLAEQDSRVVLLPAGGAFGSAAKNFYHLLRKAELAGTDYVAFADQDDVWYPDKLERAIQLLRGRRVDAVSSNVMAVGLGGQPVLVNKAQPQRAYDHLFEPAGPGCTYVMTVAFAKEVREQLARLVETGGTLPAHHDWFCYVLCRASGGVWVMDPVPSMDYRQHGGNEVGVNDGVKAAQRRLKKIQSGWYRTEVLGMLRLAREFTPGDRRMAVLAQRLERGNWQDRFVLALQVWQFRRRWRDRLALAVFFLSGWFWGRR